MVDNQFRKPIFLPSFANVRKTNSKQKLNVQYYVAEQKAYVQLWSTEYIQQVQFYETEQREIDQPVR